MFPTNWPEACPPDEASDAEGIVFRLVDRDPPAASDFVTHFESGKMPKAPQCLRCGLSVFRDLRDAIHQRELFPKLGRYVARGRLLPQDGKTMLTTGRMPTHTTWWPFPEIQRAGPFSVRSGED